MTGDVSLHPQPRRTATNAPMLDAWRDGRLLLQKCGDCGLLFFYPRSTCPRCWSDALAWIESDGRGRVESFSVIRRGLAESFVGEAPVVLAEIAVTEGAAMIARVVGAGRLSIATGSAVRVVSLSEAERYPLPTFTLEDQPG